MIYNSLTNPDLEASFSTAILSGLADDCGLYMPEHIPKFSEAELKQLGSLSFCECAAKLARHFIDSSFSDTEIESLCQEAFNFPISIATLDGGSVDSETIISSNHNYILELFHGPTVAFKDFAARFMARAVSKILTQNKECRTILVATSGDTGGAIGHAFLNQPGIKVYILFPNKGISSVQERHLTTMGENSNVKAIGVEGSFDDCQALVKQAFSNKEFNSTHNLMSANSINIGRVIPQSFYFFWSSLQIKALHSNRKIAYSVPSGNLGNVTGGLIARAMGAPIDKFIVGNNINHPFIDYLETGEYHPRNSIATIANAMDIGRPNNFPRILKLFNNDYDELIKICTGSYYDDDAIIKHLRKIHSASGYLMCPHTTIAHLAMNNFLATTDDIYTSIVVSTAHPAKFKDEIEEVINQPISLPSVLRHIDDAQSRKHVMTPRLSQLRDYLDINL